MSLVLDEVYSFESHQGLCRKPWGWVCLSFPSWLICPGGVWKMEPGGAGHFGHVVSWACAFHLTYCRWYRPDLLAEVVLPGLSREASPFYLDFLPHRHLEEGSWAACTRGKTLRGAEWRNELTWFPFQKTLLACGAQQEDQEELSVLVTEQRACPERRSSRDSVMSWMHKERGLGRGTPVRWAWPKQPGRQWGLGGKVALEHSREGPRASSGRVRLREPSKKEWWRPIALESGVQGGGLGLRILFPESGCAFRPRLWLC